MGAAPRLARIDLGALAHNFAVARERARGREVIAVVKADAYGHGAPAVAGRLAAEGCTAFAVMTVDEGVALRRARIGGRVLVMGGLSVAADAEAHLEHALTAVAQHEEELAWLGAAAGRARVAAPLEVEVDTAMHRMGVPADEAPAFLERVAGDPALRLDGVFTHFARSEEDDAAPTAAQAERFRAVLEAARSRGVKPGRIHAANSGALLASPTWGEAATPGDAVRVGLMLYGAAPGGVDPALRPVMTLSARVAALRRLEPGDPVGYGATWRAPAAGWLATLPLGYADGVPWCTGNRGAVLLGGARRPIVGRVSMDSITVWLGDTSVSVGDEAILFGDTQRALPVEDAARAAGTIPYELLVRVGARVPRVVD